MENTNQQTFDFGDTKVTIGSMPSEAADQMAGGSHVWISACRTFENLESVDSNAATWLRDLSAFLTAAADQLEKTPNAALRADLTDVSIGKDAETYAWLKQRLASACAGQLPG